MKTAYETIRAVLIGFGSYQVLWLIYLYLRPSPNPNSTLHITMEGFTIDYPEFVIPVAIIAMVVGKRFPLDERRYDLYEGLANSVMYVAIIFVPDMLNLILGWVAGEDWGDRYFKWLPVMKPMTIFSFLAVPPVILCVRNLIDKPFLRRFGNRLGLK